ncbi:hypothetical protein D9M73_297150 [compost metagenome]
MAPAILEAAEVGVVHQADVAALGTLDDDDVVFVEVFALVYEFHVALRNGSLGKSKRYHDQRLHCRPSCPTHDKSANQGSKMVWARSESFSVVEV